MRCATVIAALPVYKKQTLKSQMCDRLLIVKLGVVSQTAQAQLSQLMFLQTNN